MTCKQFQRPLHDQKQGLSGAAKCPCGLDVTDANAAQPCAGGYPDIDAAASTDASTDASGGAFGTAAADNRAEEDPVRIEGPTPHLQIIDYAPLLGERGDWLSLHLRVDAEPGRYREVNVRITGRLPSAGALPLNPYDPDHFSRFETQQFTTSVTAGGRWVAGFHLDCTDVRGQVHRFWAEDTLPIVFGTDSEAVMRQHLTPYVAGFRSTIKVKNGRTGVLHSYKGINASDIEIENEGVISVGEFKERFSTDLREGATLSKSLFVLPTNADSNAATGREGLLERVNAALPRGGIGFSLSAVRTRAVGGADAQTLRLGNSLAFSLRIERDGYLTLIDIGTSGASYLLSPNAFVTPVRAKVSAGKHPRLPGSHLFNDDMDLIVHEASPTGNETLIALITPRPLVDPAWLRDTSRDQDDWDAGRAQPITGLDETRLNVLCRALDDLGDDWRAGLSALRVIP